MFEKELILLNIFRFVQFANKSGGPHCLGVQNKPGGDIVEISTDSRIPNTLKEFLEGGDEFVTIAKRYEFEGAV